MRNRAIAVTDRPRDEQVGTTMTASVAELTGSQDGMAGGWESIHYPRGLGKIPRTFLEGPFHISFLIFSASPSIPFLNLIVRIK